MRHVTETYSEDKETREKTVGRPEVLKAVKVLMEQGLDPAAPENKENPLVLEAFALFEGWSSAIGRMENAEDRLRAYLQQNMVMFDAGWVNNAEELKAMDRELESQKEIALSENFQDYGREIDDYQLKIENKISSNLSSKQGSQASSRSSGHSSSSSRPSSGSEEKHRK